MKCWLLFLCGQCQNILILQGIYGAYSSANEYAVLGLSEGASVEEIKQAYHNLAFKHQPDLPQNKGRHRECVEKMAAINVAFERLMETFN